MNGEIVTDLDQELVELFDKEDMIAFFDFQLVVDRNETVQGLCKISEPKEGKAKSNYLSLLFIIDTIDDAMEAKVDALINGISWGGFKMRLTGSNMIIPMPHVSYGTRHYLKEIEIYLSPHLRLSPSYISDKLYPAILEILGCRANELIFWDEFSSTKTNLEPAAGQKDKDSSWVGRIIGHFKGA